MTKTLKIYKSIAKVWALNPPLVVYTQCRFIPTCSEYCQDAVQRYGWMKGLAKSIVRVIKCNPFSAVAIDNA